MFSRNFITPSIRIYLNSCVSHRSFHNTTVSQSWLSRIRDRFRGTKEDEKKQIADKDMAAMKVVIPPKKRVSKWKDIQLFEKFAEPSLNREDSLKMINEIRKSLQLQTPWSPEARLQAVKLAYQKTGRIVYDAPLQNIHNWDDLYNYYDKIVDYGDTTLHGRLAWKPTPGLMSLPNVVLHVDENGYPLERKKRRLSRSVA